MLDGQDHVEPAQVNRNVQFLRAPPPFKRGHDFALYERRFDSYCNAMNVPAEARKDLLISLLDDKVLAMIERHINDALTFEQLCGLIRRSEGYNDEHTETYASELRNRRKTRTETIMDFHLSLYRLGLKAYPNSAELRNAVVRESFLANLGEPYISARCREQPNLDMEAVLTLAIRLHNCREASKPKQSHAATANAMQAELDGEPDWQEPVPSSPRRKNRGGSNSPQPDFNTAKIDALVRMVENLNLPTVDDSMATNTAHVEALGQQSAYQYNGNRQTQGLSNSYQPYYPSHQGGNFREFGGNSNNYSHRGRGNNQQTGYARNAQSNFAPRQFRAYTPYRGQNYVRPAGEPSYHNDGYQNNQSGGYQGGYRHQGSQNYQSGGYQGGYRQRGSQNYRRGNSSNRGRGNYNNQKALQAPRPRPDHLN